MALPAYLNTYYDYYCTDKFYNPSNREKTVRLMFNTLAQLTEEIPAGSCQDSVKETLKEVGQIVSEHLSIQPLVYNNQLTQQDQTEPMEMLGGVYFNFGLIRQHFCHLIKKVCLNATPTQKNGLQQARHKLAHADELIRQYIIS